MMPSARRLQPQRKRSAAAGPWEDAAAARKVVEIFENDARIEQRRTVIEDEHRHLSKRVLLPNGVGRIHRGRRLHRHLALQLEHVHRHALTLRPKGEVGPVRMVGIGQPLVMSDVLNDVMSDVLSGWLRPGGGDCGVAAAVSHVSTGQQVLP